MLCYHQQTSTQLFTGRMPFLSQDNSVNALKGNVTMSLETSRSSLVDEVHYIEPTVVVCLQAHIRVVILDLHQLLRSVFTTG